jgi:phage baseplate assembly protein W
MTASVPTHWKPVLSRVTCLSERYRARHAVVLAQLAAANPSVDINTALRVASTNPTRAARFLLGLSHVRAHDHSITAPVRIARLEGHPAIADQVAGITSGLECIECTLAEQRPLQQTRVPLHPSRRATLIEQPNARSLVALLWEARTAATRHEIRLRMREIVRRANHSAESGAMQVCIPEENALATCENGDLWVFSPNYGCTLEDMLRDGNLSATARARVVETLGRLRRAMLAEGYVWQGFAPRNMFLRGDTLLLIDFEQAAESSHPEAAAGMLQWHQVFFADSLTTAEAELVFTEADLPGIDRDSLLHADAFERSVLGRPKITWTERSSLLKQSVILEGRHKRLQRGHGELLGHELGHFWGDFLAPVVESEIFRALTRPLSGRRRSACLEVFEAAMEADICRLMIQEAEGVPAGGAARTSALTHSSFAVLAGLG